MEEFVDIEVTVEHTTGAAVLISIDEEKTWIPKSVITTDLGSVQPGDELTIEVAGWFAIKEGLS